MGVTEAMGVMGDMEDGVGEVGVMEVTEDMATTVRSRPFGFILFVRNY